MDFLSALKINLKKFFNANFNFAKNNLINELSFGINEIILLFSMVSISVFLFESKQDFKRKVTVYYIRYII